jgi:hypothetical protein
VHIQVLKKAQTRFELNAELLLLVCKAHVQTSWINRELTNRPTHLRDRVEPGLVVVVDPKADLEERLKGFNSRVCAIPFSPDRRESLYDSLAKRLPLANPFDRRDPVQGRELVGREPFIQGICRDLHHHSAIGLFGLRKMGKTSVARAVSERLAQGSDSQQLDQKTGWLAVELDAQEFATSAIEDLLGELITQMVQPSYLPRALQDPWRGLKWAMEEAMQRNEHLLLYVDEFDLLFEPNYRIAKGCLGFLTLLRGLLQKYKGRLHLLFVGRDPSRLNAAQILGESNPMMSLWRPTWVGPLGRPEQDELLRRLGKKAGLEVGHQSKSTAERLTGGHPLLLRIYGSALWRLAQEQPPVGSDRLRATDPLSSTAEQEFLGSADVHTISEEVSLLLNKVDPHALEALKVRSRQGGPVHAAPESLQLLCNLGLLGRGEAQPMAEYLRRAFGHLPPRGQAA